MKALIGRFQATLPGRVVRKFGEDQAPKQAVLIAWNGIFAMFPILLVVAGLLGFVLSAAGFKTLTIYQEALGAIPDDATRQQALQAIEGFKTKSGLFFIVGFAGLLWSGSALFGAMEEAFDLVFHTAHRNFVKQKLMSFFMIILFAVLAGFTILSSSLLPAIERLPFLPGFLAAEPAAALIQAVTGIVSGCILFFAIYYIVPNRRQRLKKVWVGALLAGVLFEVLTLAFPIYLHFTNTASTYGKTFGLLFVLLTYFYFVGLITMLGAELNSVLFPVPVEQPEKATALAPPRSGPEGEGAVVPSGSGGGARASAGEVAAEPAPVERRRRRAGAAILVAATASVVGLVVGRRSGKRAAN